MGRLPQVDSTITEVSRLYHNVTQSRLLITSIGLKIFDHLETRASAEDVAAALGTDPGNTMLALDALCACGLIDKSGGTYQNRSTASDLLVRGKPAYLGRWLMNADQEYSGCLEAMPEMIRKGPGAVTWKRHMNSEEFCEFFTEDHAATSLAGAAGQFARNVAGLPGFGACRSMLDLGGGPGINAMAVVEAHRELKATVFDRPSVVCITSRYIKQYGFEDQISVIGGNYLEDPIGAEYDMIMVSDSLYYAREEIDRVVTKCREALRPGGFMVGFHPVLTHERTQPANLVVAMLPDSLTGQGSLPDKGFMEQSLRRCGFDDVTSSMVAIGDVMMEMNVGHRG